VQISAELSSPSSAARLKSAGDNELVEVDSLVAQARQLASHLAANHDADYAVEMSRLTDLVSATASAKATIIAAMAALSQSPTSTTLANVRSALIQLRSPLGKIAEAKADASEIVALLNGG
jgi:predicted ABC-type transport system involved in lysophospholipase L1 biosynthesis ATPase subunit